METQGVCHEYVISRDYYYNKDWKIAMEFANMGITGTILKIVLIEC